MSRIEADYRIETAWPLAEAAEAMAGEQSSGTFLPIPGETPELKARAAARVEALEDLGPVEAPSLPGAGRPDAPHRQGRVTLSWPIGNMGPSLPNLMAAVGGNLFELGQFSGLRLLDIRLPEEFADANPGPGFGIEGTRRLSGVEGRPLVGTIVKPSVGLDAAGTAALVADLCAAGLDFIKDDELQGDGPSCPFEDRARAVMAEIDRAADRTGRKTMFAFNVTGEVDEMRRRHDLVLELGGTCVMVNLTGVGLTGLLALRRHAALADPRASQRLGRAVTLAGLGLRLRALGQDAPAGGRGPHARERASEQVLRAGRERDRLGAVVPDADVSEQALHGDAGVLVGAVGGAGLGHLCGAGIGGSDLRGGRRDHGASGRAGGGGDGAARGLGRGAGGRERCGGVGPGA